jgi:hypothetical protein
VVEELRVMKLAKTAEIVENGIPETPSYLSMRRNIGAASGLTTRWNA